MHTQSQTAGLELRCMDARCATLVAAGSEVCDECGGAALARVTDAQALLVGAADNRPVAFELRRGQPNIIGRATAGMPLPEIDLSRFSDNASVHRRHAQIDERQGQWTITHLGRNPLTVSRPEGTLVVEPGTSASLRTGDWIQLGRVRLRLVLDPARGI